MKSIKSVIKSSPAKIEPVQRFPVPDIFNDEARFNALKNVIIQAHLSCAQPVPDPEFVNALIISWNKALWRIPTSYLEPALQHAIENHNGIGKINCSIICRAFRELLLRQKNEHSYQLPGPRTSPPKEYYDLLAKIGIFPQPVAAPEKVILKKVRPQYKIEKRESICGQCSTQVKILVIYQDNQLCLDCAIRAEIIKESK
jgi:hypothetical protein